MKKRATRILLWSSLAGLILVAAGAAVWVRTFRYYRLKDVMEDVQAGLKARNIREPQPRVEAFLEARYGPLTEPANRQRAFLDFFNQDHIKGLNFIVSHTPTEQKQANTQAMAEWIANYRNTMSPDERVALQARLNSEEGRALLRQATARYQAQDVYFRGAQKPVIRELMTTLAALRQP
jgi:hypothetical protein